MERKKPIKKNHIRNLAVGCPEGVPGTNSGRPRDTWDIWAWFMCKSILKGQNVPGTDGTYHGTDGTCPRDRRDAHQGCPAKILYVYWFFSFPKVGQWHFWCYFAHLLESKYRQSVKTKAREWQIDPALLQGGGGGCCAHAPVRKTRLRPEGVGEEGPEKNGTGCSRIFHLESGMLSVCHGVPKSPTFCFFWPQYFLTFFSGFKCFLTWKRNWFNLHQPLHGWPSLTVPKKTAKRW